MNILIGSLAFSYGLMHSLTASTQFKQGLLQHIPAHIYRYRLAFNLLAIILLIGLLGLVIQEAGMPAPSFQNPFVLGLGIAAFIAGAWLGYTAFQYYDTADFLGISKTATQAEPLNTRGPNRFVRHPLYSATLLLFAGICLCFPYASVWAACAGLSLYLPLGIYWEEKKLIQLYGDEYRNYQKSAKRLIPGIW